MPLQATSGAASQDAFGGNGVAVVPTYIEEVFSNYLWSGDATTTRTITNNIDVSGKGGLVWIKARNIGEAQGLFDTNRGATYELQSANNGGQSANVTTLKSFTSSGFTIGSNDSVNGNTYTYTSWTFRKQPKFFDLQTWSGSGANRTISHALGSVPACIMVKRTDATASNWAVYHRSLANTDYLVLNTTAASATGATRWNSTTPTSTEFSLGTDATVNASGGTYVAYIFAHDAGGFGLTGTDNVISCGSYTGNGSATGPVVTLGYEPQWLMIKKSSSTGNWQMIDNMRGMPVGSADATLQANLSDAETSVEYVSPTATGFQITSTNTEVNTNAATYIYIACRRGPMKVPTTGTSVFSPVARTGTGAATTVTSAGFPPDLVIVAERDSTQSGAKGWYDRLRNPQNRVSSTSTNAETATYADSITALTMNGMAIGADSNNQVNYSAATYINWFFKRAPSFFDEVCYTGDGVSGRTIEHNLGVVPELMIVKCRTDVDLWPVYSATLGPTKYITLNTGVVTTTSGSWNNTAPTALVFSVGPNSYVNFSSSRTYVAYLFGTCAGVSKVFSYTGNGSSQTINCGFTGGARFVLIVRTDSTGNWYVWDTARGIVSGNDPHLRLNSTAAEVTTDDSVDTDNTGFIVNQVAATNVNVTSATYIGIAIA